jgi:uncharacterized protein
MSSAARAPTDPVVRVTAIDALRGWALSGIAIVNVPWIGFRESLHSLLVYERNREALAPWDFGAALLVEGLCEGRFYPIFSALFGLGSGLLLARGPTLYGRRIAALGAFGLLHATFGWYGDVLLNYAAAGVFLAFLVRFGPRPLLAVSALLLALTEVASFRFDDWLAPDEDGWAEHAARVEAETRIYRDGTFVSITAHRFDEVLTYFTAPWNVSYRLNVLAMATLGLAIERGGVLARLHALRPRIGRLALVLIAVGLALSVALLALPQIYILAGDVLAGGWALGFLWFALGPRAARWTAPFAAVGRMALTSYVGQTLAFTLFFYGYGLAMYGALGPAAGVALALAVYAVEAVFATAWLRRFEYGPLEWIWRAVTYLHPPPMRRRAR